VYGCLSGLYATVLYAKKSPSRRTAPSVEISLSTSLVSANESVRRTAGLTNEHRASRQDERKGEMFGNMPSLCEGMSGLKGTV
jgi:hypothetical protein